jgi:hypothetical protein
MTELVGEVLCEHLSSKRLKTDFEPVVVDSLKEFLDATRDSKSIAFLDATTLPAVAEVAHHVKLTSSIILVCSKPLPTAVGWLQHDWICHVMSSALIEHTIGPEHLENVLRTLMSTKPPRLLDWLGESVDGRRVRLTHASRRAERIERMSDFLQSKGVGSRTAHQLKDAAEELLTNAFYDAPVTAGALKKPVPRTQDIALPDDSACDLAYGCRGDLVIVRVRDPFGSLSRQRLVQVLTRCARTDMQVEVDETMGGAGLGMWRIFSAASFVGVSVIKNRRTEILVGIAKRSAPGPKPFAFHFFFRDSGKRSFWGLAKDDTTDASLHQSVMLVARSK